MYTRISLLVHAVRSQRTLGYSNIDNVLFFVFCDVFSHIQKNNLFYLAHKSRDEIYFWTSLKSCRMVKSTIMFHINKVSFLPILIKIYLTLTACFQNAIIPYSRYFCYKIYGKGQLYPVHAYMCHVFVFYH